MQRNPLCLEAHLKKYLILNKLDAEILKNQNDVSKLINCIQNNAKLFSVCNCIIEWHINYITRKI